MENIKIVHICSYLHGGAGTAAFRIHEAQLNEGIDSNFLCLDSENNDKFIHIIEPKIKHHSKNIISRVLSRLRRVFFENLTKRTIFINRYLVIKSSLECEYSSIPYADFDVLSNYLVKSADIIHLHWVAGILDYPRFFSKVNKPIVWTFHDMNPFQGIFHYKEDELRNLIIAEKINNMAIKIKMKSIQSCKPPIQIVCPSQWLTLQAKLDTFYSPLKFNTIPYPIDFNIFQRKNKKSIREKFEINENEIVFLFACQSIGIFRKGFYLLVEALKTIINENVTIFVIGEEDTFNIENLKIKFSGTIRDNVLLSQYYSLADAFIIPSREDNLPNVMLESLSCGTPVIGFPIGGIKEHVINHITGILAKEVSSESLLEALKEFIINKDNFNATTIRNYAIKNFDNSAITSLYSQIYKSFSN